MRTKIKKIPARDFNKAMELFAESCRRDRFYRSLFREDDCFSSIKQQFNMDVWRTIQFGEALGAYAGKTLIGVLFGIDLQDWKNNHASDLEHMFSYDKNNKLDWWYKALTEYGNKLDRRITYVYAICTDGQFRRKGVASMLIKELCILTKKRSLVLSDADNEAAKGMWLHNGFQFVDLTTEEGKRVRFFVNTR